MYGEMEKERTQLSGVTERTPLRARMSEEVGGVVERVQLLRIRIEGLADNLVGAMPQPPTAGEGKQPEPVGTIEPWIDALKGVQRVLNHIDETLNRIEREF